MNTEQPEMYWGIPYNYSWDRAYANEFPVLAEGLDVVTMDWGCKW
jgi:hypothetical protein